MTTVSHGEHADPVHHGEAHSWHLQRELARNAFQLGDGHRRVRFVFQLHDQAPVVRVGRFPRKKETAPAPSCRTVASASSIDSASLCSATNGSPGTLTGSLPKVAQVVVLLGIGARLERLDLPSVPPFRQRMVDLVHEILGRLEPPRPWGCDLCGERSDSPARMGSDFFRNPHAQAHKFRSVSYFQPFYVAPR